MSDPRATANAVGDRTLSPLARWALMALAVLSLILAVIGALLPVMPTVPFILLAAWAASRSSPRLSNWLESHPRMGPPIREWRAGGVVRRPVKWWATATMSGGGVFMLAMVEPWWIAAAGIGMMVAVGTWIWLRPELPR
jgi:uncharacterized membrane protein YbaN (DUF454 family)